MATTRKCSVFDEGLDAPCVVQATLVRTVVREDAFPTCSYYCQEHGIAHGAVRIEVAQDVRRLFEKAVRSHDAHMLDFCARALLGDEPALDECLAAAARKETR